VVKYLITLPTQSAFAVLHFHHHSDRDQEEKTMKLPFAMALLALFLVASFFQDLAVAAGN
jgi:hypothetical protein